MQQDEGNPSDPLEVFRHTVFESFSDVDDPRLRQSRVQHGLSNIFFITLCAVLCGANNLQEVVAYAKSRQEWLNNILTMPFGIPSYDTFRTVYVMLDPQTFSAGFTKWVNSLVDITRERVLAVDGKALRGTAVKGEANSFIHMVSLWACDLKLTLAQYRVDDKSNEITAIPQLLNMIDLSGTIITIDAMGTQTAIARKIVDSGGDYILALKGNQSNLHDEVKNFFDQAQAIGFEGVEHTSYDSIEKGHGRVEQRTCIVTEDLDWLPQREKWAKLQSIVMIQSKRTLNGETSTERRVYISSLPGDANKIAHAIRSHWGIENGCHWVLNVAFREDALKARSGHITENLSIIRRMALNLLKQDKSKGGVELKRKKAAWDPAYLLKVMAVKFS